MKKALFAIIAALILGFAFSNLYAWGGGPGRCGGPCYNRFSDNRGDGYRGLHYLEFLKDEIGLTDEQIQKIIKIDSDYRLKYFNNRKDSAKIGELRTEHQKEIGNVFTEEQKKKLDEYKQENKKQFYRHPGWRR